MCMSENCSAIFVTAGPYAGRGRRGRLAPPPPPARKFSKKKVLFPHLWRFRPPQDSVSPRPLIFPIYPQKIFKKNSPLPSRRPSYGPVTHGLTCLVTCPWSTFVTKQHLKLASCKTNSTFPDCLANKKVYRTLQHSLFLHLCVLFVVWFLFVTCRRSEMLMSGLGVVCQTSVSRGAKTASQRWRQKCTNDFWWRILDV